jgi:hypothetical protein
VNLTLLSEKPFDLSVPYYNQLHPEGPESLKDIAGLFEGAHRRNLLVFVGSAWAANAELNKGRGELLERIADVQDGFASAGIAGLRHKGLRTILAGQNLNSNSNGNALPAPLQPGRLFLAPTTWFKRPHAGQPALNLTVHRVLEGGIRDNYSHVFHDENLLYIQGLYLSSVFSLQPPGGGGKDPVALVRQLTNPLSPPQVTASRGRASSRRWPWARSR